MNVVTNLRAKLERAADANFARAAKLRQEALETHSQKERKAKLQAAKACEDSAIRQVAKLGEMG